MPYLPHTYVTLGGTIPLTSGLKDIWQIGIRGSNDFDAVTPIPQAELAAYVASVRDAVVSWFQAAATAIPSSATLDWIKAANIGPDGKYTGDPAILEVGVPGGSASQSIPAMCCAVYSWDSGKILGRARTGRVYPPNFGVQRDTGSSITTAAQTSAANAGKALLTAVYQPDDDYPLWQPRILSSTGAWNKIAAVRVGNLIDVQRRRKNASPETYVSVDV